MSKKYTFITDQFKSEIYNNVINQVFKKLKEEHKDILLLYLLEIVELISFRFNFDKTTYRIYENQFRQNNYRDLQGLLLMLLPYIDDESGEKKTELYTLDELIIKKKDNSSNNINNTEPKYEFTNFQYGRCNRYGFKNNKEIKFNLEFLKHNYLLLKETIVKIAHKLYVNWMDIKPISFDQIQKIPLYINTDKQIKNNNLSYVDILSGNDADDAKLHYQGLDISDIYDTISNRLFESIKNIKWIIYDINLGTELYPELLILHELLNLNQSINNISWQQLTDIQRSNFTNNWKKISNINTSQINDIQINNLKNIVKYLMFFFNKYYKKLSEAKEKKEYIEFYPLFKTSENDELDDYQIDVSTLNFDSGDLRKSIDSLNPKHMYEYIRDTLVLFKNTWYKNKLIKKSNIDNKYEFLDRIEYKKEEKIYIVSITLKNYYNFQNP